jgi:nucleotide-binding universal stress UspA family protein
MDLAEAVNEPGWRILHPTDFSEASEIAFVHALKLALLTHGQLRVLHVSRDDGPVRWRSFPGVREALERWGVLPAGSPPSAVGGLGIDVRKVDAIGDDPVLLTHDFLGRHPADVIVLATHQRDGLARWREPSVAEAIARHARQVTLFVPGGAGGFVDAATGEIRLGRVLIPVDRVPAPQPALAAAVALAALGARAPVTFRMVHVGEAEFPAVSAHEQAEWAWDRRTLTGDPATALVAAMRDWPPDLVVMATQGHHGFMDALRGSTTERVLRAAPCPLLAVPVSARLPRLAWR